jgi:hypothetical protein
VEHVKIFTEERECEWWVMSKNTALPEPAPVGQRFIRMVFPRVLKVVHSTKAEAELEATWLRQHLQDWEKSKGKAQRLRLMKLAAQRIL